jgi:hypothetical protein
MTHEQSFAVGLVRNVDRFFVHGSGLGTGGGLRGPAVDRRGAGGEEHGRED